MYNTESKYTPMPTFEKHNSYITHFDFSQDSRYLQSNDGAYELLFGDVSTGAHIPAASALKDVQWATWTCTLGCVADDCRMGERGGVCVSGLLRRGWEWLCCGQVCNWLPVETSTLQALCQHFALTPSTPSACVPSCPSSLCLSLHLIPKPLPHPLSPSGGLCRAFGPQAQTARM